MLALVGYNNGYFYLFILKGLVRVNEDWTESSRMVSFTGMGRATDGR